MALTDEDVVRSLLAPGGVRAEFQPIVRLADRSVEAWEALGRVDGVAGVADLPPDRALAMAAGVGRAADLEVAYWDAVVAAGPPPGGAALFVNCGSAGLGDPRMEERLASIEAPVIVEITELVADDDPVTARQVDRWAALGVRFAVDDAGTGYSSLRRVLDLGPEYLKLDASLVQGIASDTRLRAVLVAMLALASALDARLIAEGVEDAADLRVLEEEGVPLAQGFVLGRPGPPWTMPPTAAGPIVDLSR